MRSIKMPNLFRLSRIAIALLLFVSIGVHAQNSQIDVGVTYIAQRSLQVNTEQNFWLQGGSIELGADVWKGWGVAADVTGGHTDSVGTGGVPLSLVTATFGPRYRWKPAGKISLYGQALVGEANGFDSVFPSPGGVQSSTNSLALQIGGGVDYRISGRIAIRALDAGWLRTQLPNSVDNVQNTLRLGAGMVVRFGRRP
jgi:peptidoglycan-associated lipoprotein